MVRRPYLIPKIADVLQKLEGMHYAISLDLNMSYYTVRLDPDSQKLCTIITPRGKYQYLWLLMGVNVSPHKFLAKMSDLMARLELVHTYLDDLLIISNLTFEHHRHQLQVVLRRLERGGAQGECRKNHNFFCN